MGGRTGLPYRAVIVDLDRTLLRTDKTVSDYTLDVLRKWQEAGAALFAATARPERAITEYTEVIRFRSVTTLNGARTVTPAAVLENTIRTGSAVSILLQLISAEGMMISAEAENGIYANFEHPLWNPAVIDDIERLPEREKIYKILVSHAEIPADRISVTLPGDVYCTVADRKLLQFMGSEATKWNGIRQMLEHDGIRPEEAVFFGDDNDDIEPIARCGLGVAVSNALDRVKEAADDVALSNDEDGVAKYLDGLMNRP